MNPCLDTLSAYMMPLPEIYIHMTCKNGGPQKEKHTTFSNHQVSGVNRELLVSGNVYGNDTSYKGHYITK